MDARAIAVHLLARCGSLGQVEAYMFGSTLSGIGTDVDILIVGEDHVVFAELKRELRSAGKHLPLHLLFMEKSEERRFDFVVRERCVPLGVLAQPDVSSLATRAGRGIAA